MKKHYAILFACSLAIGSISSITTNIYVAGTGHAVDESGVRDWPSVKSFLRRGERFLGGPADPTEHYEILSASRVIQLDRGCRAVRIKCRKVFDETVHRPAQHRDTDAIYILDGTGVVSMHYCGYNGGIRDTMAYASLFPR